MIIKRHILASLNSLELRYDAAMKLASVDDSIYFSKLAILEYCGWLEEAFDKIVMRAIKGKLKTTPFQDILRDSVVGNNYGFQYKEHFRPMLIKAIGLVAAERIENYLNTSGTLQILISELDSVKIDRNTAAHTWSKGTTRTYPAPSVTRSRLLTVYPIARDMYAQMVHL